MWKWMGVALMMRNHLLRLWLSFSFKLDCHFMFFFEIIAALIHSMKFSFFGAQALSQLSTTRPFMESHCYV